MGGGQDYGPFFWVPTIVRHLVFRVPKKGPQMGFKVEGQNFFLGGYIFHRANAAPLRAIA